MAPGSRFRGAGRCNPPLITDDQALTQLPSGRLLATFTFRNPKDPVQNNRERFRLARSSDGGRTWVHLAPLDLTVAMPLVHENCLFLLGNALGRRDIVITRSDDEGESWCPPVTLYKGAFWNAPTAMATMDGRVYRAFTGGPPEGTWEYRSLVVIAGDLSRDLLDPGAWRMSNEVRYPGTPRELVCNRYPDHWTDHWLEPNVVSVAGRIRVLVRTRMDGYATSGMCAVCDLTDEDGRLSLRFTQFHPMPGGQNKFHLVYDAAQRLFWTTVNLPTDTQDIQDREGRLKAQGFAGRPGNERRFLFLQYSVDALNWSPAGCVAMWHKTSQSFHYVGPLIDGNDMLLLTRTSRNAANQHDSELVTLHRVKDFRSLVLDLYARFDAE